MLLNNIKKKIDTLILKDIEEQLKIDYQNKYEAVIIPSRCYGIYNDAVVIFIPLPQDAEKTLLYFRP